MPTRGIYSDVTLPYLTSHNEYLMFTAGPNREYLSVSAAATIAL